MMYDDPVIAEPIQMLEAVAHAIQTSPAILESAEIVDSIHLYIDKIRLKQSQGILYDPDEPWAGPGEVRDTRNGIKSVKGYLREWVCLYYAANYTFKRNNSGDCSRFVMPQTIDQQTKAIDIIQRVNHWEASISCKTGTKASNEHAIDLYYGWLYRYKTDCSFRSDMSRLYVTTDGPVTPTHFNFFIRPIDMRILHHMHHDDEFQFVDTNGKLEGRIATVSQRKMNQYADRYGYTPTFRESVSFIRNFT